MKKVKFMFSAIIIALLMSSFTSHVSSQDKEFVKMEESGSGCLSYDITYNEYVKSYCINFYNNCGEAVTVRYEFHNGSKWIANATIIGVGKSCGWPAGPEGRVRNIEYE